AGLARGALARGDTASAVVQAERAVDVARRNPHRRSAEPWRALGAALTAAERFDQAEPALLDALAQDRKHHGADGIDTARSLAQLGKLYLRQGRAGDARPPVAR